jgi:autotransporter strand-loop-strand O-heptosyltransferase
MEDKVAIKLHTFALGDSISAIPTINKLSKIYESPITVFASWSHLFKDHPSVLECKTFEDSSEGYIVHNTFQKGGIGNIDSICKKHNAIDIRQYHAWDLGISLTSDELTCDLYCEEEKDIGFEDYVLIHPSKTWNSRTWSEDKWQELTDKLIQLGLKVVIIGSDVDQMEFDSTKGEMVSKNICNVNGGINLINKTNIPELRWMMNNKALCVITMDSGILHVAGTTDCNIIQLGSSIDYKLRAPWRNGNQEYKYQYVSGGCDIFCASNLKYGLREHGDIHGIPPLNDCKEEYEEFLCHSSVDDVVNAVTNVKEFNKIIEKNKIMDGNEIIIDYKESPKVTIKGNNKEDYFVEFIDSSNNKIIHSSTIKNGMWTSCNREWFTKWIIKVNGKIVDRFNLENKRVYIELGSKALGDTIAWTPYVVKFAKKYNCKVVCTTFHNEWFENIPDYKDIEFVNHGKAGDYYIKYNIGWYKNLEDNNWDRKEMNPTPVNLIPLQQTATDILGLEFEEFNLGVDLGKGRVPIYEKYVVFGPQATSGCKEWNIDKWKELSVKFIEAGYKVVICSLRSYDIPNTIECNGELEVTATHLKHADAFIGLGSGLSWLNWALGKRTYMINGFAKEGHEFKDNLIKITNDVCIKCWNDPVHTFDPGDWNWCPVYKGSELQHICQQSITVNQVFNIIKADLDIN